MPYLNPFRYIGDYIVIVCNEQTDVENTTALCLEKALAFQAHIVLFGNWLTIAKISDMLVLADQRGQRNRLGYALSDDEESLLLIKQDAVMMIDAVPCSGLKNQ